LIIWASPKGCETDRDRLGSRARGGGEKWGGWAGPDYHARERARSVNADAGKCISLKRKWGKSKVFTEKSQTNTERGSGGRVHAREDETGRGKKKRNSSGGPWKGVQLQSREILDLKMPNVAASTKKASCHEGKVAEHVRTDLKLEKWDRQ